MQPADHRRDEARKSAPTDPGPRGGNALQQAAAILTQTGRRSPFDGLPPWPTRLALAAAEGLHPDSVARRCARWGVPTRVRLTAEHRARVEINLQAYLQARSAGVLR